MENGLRHLARKKVKRKIAAKYIDAFESLTAVSEYCGTSFVGEFAPFTTSNQIFDSRRGFYEYCRNVLKSPFRFDWDSARST